MRFRLIKYSIIYILTIYSCFSKKQEIKQVINHWMGKEIVFSDTIKSKIHGKDTVCALWNEHKYKIFHYVDTTGCSECQLKFYEWGLLQKQIDSLKADVSIIFVVFAKHYTPIEISQRLNKFDIPIFYDVSGDIGKKNNFSFNPKYKTFLLDSLNRVIGIGNPVTNKRIWDLYKSQICPSCQPTHP